MTPSPAPDRLTALIDEVALCVCGHAHQTVTIDGVTSVFHRCRGTTAMGAPCPCDEFRTDNRRLGHECACGHRRHDHEPFTTKCGVTAHGVRCGCYEFRPAEAERAAFENVREHLEAWRAAEIEAQNHRQWVMAALHPLRERTDLSLRTAARKAGISAAALSLAEQMKLSLSFLPTEALLDVLESAAVGR